MTTCLGQENTRNMSTKKIVAAIGKWMPIHKGHKKFLINFAKDSNVEKLIVMLGSCYERSETKYSITANEREKMIRAIMNREGISEDKYVIVPVSDYDTFEEWIFDVLDVCKEYKVTHFCTGNREDILDVLEKNNMDLGLELINPETDSNFPYHATDIRNMIINGEYEKMKDLIPDEVKPILFKYTFKEILAASMNKGINFIHGRQTVDTILIVRNNLDGKVYALMGRRPKDKQDFPGFLAFPGGKIRKHETAINAAIRVFFEETGLKIKLLDNSLEPAIIRFEGLPKLAMEQMYVNGIYGSMDQKKNGTRGGSSQCFTIFVEGNLEDYKKLIISRRGLENVAFYEVEKAMKKKLAFEHKDMLKKAINMLEAYPKLHKKYMKANGTEYIKVVGSEDAIEKDLKIIKQRESM